MSGDQPLAVQRRGSGPALMLLHGFTGSGGSMQGVAGSLAGQFATLAPDLPGHGASIGEPVPRAYGFEASIDALAATLEAAGHARGHWLGYSMGARLALACAIRHPARVESLVLLAGRAGIADPAERAARRCADEALAARIEAIGVAAFVDEWLAQPLFGTLRHRGPGFLARERAARSVHDPRGLAACLRGLGPAAQPPLFDALARVRVPVLLVAGALDARFVDLAHDLARRLPRAEVRTIPSAGHAAHVEEPAAFTELVTDFLSRARGPAATLPMGPPEETVS